MRVPSGCSSNNCTPETNRLATGQSSGSANSTHTKRVALYSMLAYPRFPRLTPVSAEGTSARSDEWIQRFHSWGATKIDSLRCRWKRQWSWARAHLLLWDRRGQPQRRRAPEWPEMKSSPNKAVLLTALRAAADSHGVGRADRTSAAAASHRRAPGERRLRRPTARSRRSRGDRVASCLAPRYL